MLLNDHDHSVELRPVRYQFPARGDRYDDNWLVVEGTVTTPEGSWTFTDACLLTDEAREISDWLRSRAADLEFIEPVLAFSRESLGSHQSEAIRVHLSHEAAPPWLEGDDRLDAHVIEIRAAEAAIQHAADTWDRLLAPFPPR